MFGQFTITYKGAPKISKKLQNRLKKDTLTRIGFQWHKLIRLKHFTAEGARQYRYAKRKTKEVTTGTIKKTKRGKPRAPSGRPLVWSGRSESLSRRPKIMATAKRVRVRYPIRVFNFKAKNNPALDLRSEFTTVLTKERDRLAQDGKKDLTKRLRAINKTTVVRITP